MKKIKSFKEFINESVKDGKIIKKDLDEYVGKTIKEFREDFDGINEYFYAVFTDGSSLAVTAYPSSGGVGLTYESEEINEAYDIAMKDSEIEEKFIGRKVQKELERYKYLANKYQEQMDNFKKDFAALKKMLADLDKNYGTISYLSQPRHSNESVKFKIVVESKEDLKDFKGYEELGKIEKAIDSFKSMGRITDMRYGDTNKFEYFDHVPGYIMYVSGQQ